MRKKEGPTRCGKPRRPLQAGEHRNQIPRLDGRTTNSWLARPSGGIGSSSIEGGELICRTVARGLRGVLRTRLRSAQATVPLFYRRDVNARAVPIVVPPIEKLRDVIQAIETP